MRERKLIGVAGPCSGCGVSFVSGLIAAYLKDRGKVSLVELGSPYFYSALDLKKSFGIKPFMTEAQLLACGGKIRDAFFEHKGINWFVKGPGEAEPDAPAIFRLLANVPGEYVIADFSSMEGQLLYNCLAECDEKLIVVDPLPSKLYKGFRQLELLRLQHRDAHLLINKSNGGVHKSELNRFLGAKSYLSLPHIDPSLIYKAEYNCILPYELKDVKKQTERDLKMISQALSVQ